MKVVLVDCLIYQGLLWSQRQHAATSPERDTPTTTRMKKAHFVPEVVLPGAVASFMPGKFDAGTLDSIWVYWPPDNLVMWSREIQAWTDILFVTDSELPDGDLSFIQNAELSYIAAADLSESPYIFRIT
jgi:hypothetical protein